MTQKAIRLVPLGGLGEVGKNMLSVEYGENILIIDAGIMFPENDMLGIDYIIPDFEYLLNKKDKVRGIVVTHGTVMSLYVGSRTDVNAFEFWSGLRMPDAWRLEDRRVTRIL